MKNSNLINSRLRLVSAFTLGTAAAVSAIAAAIGPSGAGGIAQPTPTYTIAAAGSSPLDAISCQGCGPVNGLGRVPHYNNLTGAPDASGGAKIGGIPPLTSSPISSPDGASPATSWQQIPFVPRNPPTPPSRDTGGSAYDELHAEVVIFGGRHYTPAPPFLGSELNDTWAWNGTTWTEKLPTTKPPSRFFTVMAYDAAIGKTILFGGQTCVGGTLGCPDLNDTWAWDGSNWTKINTAVSPPARHGASLAYDAAHQQFVLFGGNFTDTAGVHHFLNDTWTFDGTNWTPASIEGPPPRSGDNSLMTYVPANNGLVLFGGSFCAAISCVNFNDTWLWDGTKWAPLTPATSPASSFDIAIAYDDAIAKAVLYRFENETWTWDGTNWQLSASFTPSSRSGPVYAYDKAVQKILLYAGVNNLPEFDDEWLWDGSSWTQGDTGDKFPFARLPEGQMAFDSARDQVVLFSGVRDFASMLFDTWTWNGSAWTWLHPAIVPPGRGFGAMAYDAERGVTVLFGGSLKVSTSTVTNDTWTFDGTNWSKKTPLVSPSARQQMGMAFDNSSRKIVLFGGIGSGGAGLNDTWSWDGSNWALEQPPTKPPARFFHSMSHDAQGRPLMFGGETCPSGCTYFNDTWRWDGITHNWQQIATTGAIPPGRWGASMGYDAASQRIILFGGRTGTLFGDTWTFDGNNWELLSPGSSPSARAFFGLSDGSLTNPPVLMGGAPSIGQGYFDAWTWGTPVIPIAATSAVSRKTHGAAGAFDINLPLTGTPGIECRTGGVSNDYQLIVNFASAVTFNSAAVTAGTGSVSGTSGSGTSAVTVNLTGVSNAQTITLTLAGVSNGTNTGDVAIRVGVLVGDTTADGFVNSGDISQTKSQSGATITNSNFREDVTIDGFLNSGDISLVKSKSGTALP